MAASGEITVRPMTKIEVGIAIDWAEREGWNPGLSDGDCYYAVDPQAFFAVLHDGRLIGSFSVMVYRDGFAFGGFYILDPEYRGRGIGLAIQEQADRLAAPYNFGIDGVFEMQDRYAAHGFIFSHRNIRYEGLGGGTRPPGLTDARGVPFDAIVRYDARHFPAERPGFLRHWLAQPGATALAVLEDGEVRGYGQVRPCRRGAKIGPLFADTPEIAERIYSGLSAAVPGQPLFLDVPEPNAAGVALAERHGMVPVFGTARMYTKEIPDLPLDRCYGVTSFETG
ncbi:GNAT family N-acetyltransferase [Methanoculleus sp. Wushi-C6]|uniref:GNAT family N-acetyltransferase n=1 Tax=Methanoculleus caldifontis TaxID=2651577 RepID=A0ABU3WYF4_9EURY|nr:GNAT family N-acetyltransferase [Methanoculleus sp. Wushi-C6]MDV2480835.1 GNAT family N-acetyltransferase [Methanoculleus sp. Wushi-C6]